MGASEIWNGIRDPGFGMRNGATLRPLWGWSNVGTCPWALRTLWGCGGTDGMGRNGNWMGRALRSLRGPEGGLGDSIYHVAEKGNRLLPSHLVSPKYCIFPTLEGCGASSLHYAGPVL